MKHLFEFGASMLLCVALATGFVGCSDDDPDYNDVTPPTVEVTHNISGRVTAMDGTAIGGATVSATGLNSLTTGTDGTFVFENVNAGTYTLKAEASGKIAQETTVTVAQSGEGSNPIWNATLTNEGTTITAKEDGSAEGSATSETVKGNDKGEVEVTVTAPEGAVPAGEEIVITPIYTQEGAAAVSRADNQSVMLIGTNVKCSKAGVSLSKPISMEYDVDSEVAAGIKAQKLVNDRWVDAEFTVNGDKVTVIADQFTSYSLSFGATVTTSVTSESLSFGQNEWDNLYGSNDMTVGSASFTYKIGTEINTSGTNRVTAYLIEILARMAGASVTTATGTYPINVTLPIGTAMSISGQQAVTTLTVSSLNRSASGKQYGDVAVVTRTWNRQHTGGSVTGR